MELVEDNAEAESSDAEEIQEGAALQAADPLALTEAETEAAMRVPVSKVLQIWAQNEARMDAESWLPDRSAVEGVALHDQHFNGSVSEKLF